MHSDADTLREALFRPFNMNGLELANRIVLAPCTRSRASEEGVHPREASFYYAQRAMAGLIIAEAAYISSSGKAYPNTPGLYNEEQAHAWEPIVRSVHELGCKIVVQLYHGGRVSHPLTQPNNQVPMAPSAIKATGLIFTKAGVKEFAMPREMDADDIARVILEFRNAAAVARRVGFDGIELHAGNGYLLDQFLRSSANARRDKYGGSVGNRMRLLMEVVEAVTSVWSSDRVGVRVSPVNDYNSMGDDDPHETYLRVATELSRIGIGFVDVVETGMVSRHVKPEKPTAQTQDFNWGVIRDSFRGIYMANGGYTRTRAIDAINSGRADLISFGTDFLSNPDLPFRLEYDLELNPPDKDSFYEGGPVKGYIDYPFHPKNEAFAARVYALFRDWLPTGNPGASSPQRDIPA
jgi:N-ethylmaleimide reductase